MMRHHGGGIGHLQDFCSVDDEQNGMVEDSRAAEDGTRPRGDSNVAVDSDKESETDFDTGSGSERGDDSDDSSEYDDSESDGYATPWYCILISGEYDRCKQRGENGLE